MKRSIPLLLILVAAAVWLLLGPVVPVTAGAQKEASGVTVKKDGDTLVLIPGEPGKIFLVLGCPHAGKDQKPESSSGSLAEPAGEQRIPAKEYSKIYVLEVQKLTEVDLSKPSGLQVTEKTANEAISPTGKPCACDFPIPPGPLPLGAPAVNPANPGNPLHPVNPVDPKPLGFLVGGAKSKAGG